MPIVNNVQKRKNWNTPAKGLFYINLQYFMKENPYRQDNEEIRELVKQFQNLKTGQSHSFLDEESFEKIIDYFDDAEDLQQALEAAEMGIEQ